MAVLVRLFPDSGPAPDMPLGPVVSPPAHDRRERDTFGAIGAPVAEPSHVRLGDNVAPWTSP
jgi:hypothetical protein